MAGTGYVRGKERVTVSLGASIIVAPPDSITELIDSGAIDNMGADITSAVLDIRDQTSISVELNVDNTDAVGEFYVQVSNSQVNWDNVTWQESGLDYIGVAAGVDILADMSNLPNAGFGYLRLFYDRTSGDGQLDAYVSIK